MPDWLTPRDAWPSHSRPLAQRALQRARAQGWFLKKAAPRAKPWGVITCSDPATVDRESRCSTTVLSTSGPADGSETAKHVDDLLDGCGHVRVLSGSSSLVGARTLIQSAKHCLDVVDRLIAADSHGDFVLDYLAQCESDAEEADLLLHAADEASRQEALARNEAETIARDAGMGWPVDRESILTQAVQMSRQVDVQVANETAREARMLRDEAAGIRSRASTLRRLLS